MKTISIVIPTLNNANTLHQCLESVFNQDYPLDKIEVIIVDGGSKDTTLDIARKFNVKILNNPLRTGEAGKSVGLMAAKNELVAFIDSDNILPTTDWLRRMTKPFTNVNIIGSEPVEFTYRKQDSIISRYGALFGATDPLQLYVGNRGRWSWLKLSWTDDISHKISDEGDFYIIKMRKNTRIPTMGANGFVGIRDLLLKTRFKPYYFDIDTVYDLVQDGFDTVARVKIGIIHLHANSLTAFIRKTYRRIRDYFYFKKLRTYPWPTSIKALFKFVLSTITIIPLVRDATRGYHRKLDRAWFFHPLACMLVLLTYTIVYMIAD